MIIYHSFRIQKKKSQKSLKIIKYYFDLSVYFLIEMIYRIYKELFSYKIIIMICDYFYEKLNKKETN